MTVRATTLQNRAGGLPAEDHRLIRAFWHPASTTGLHGFPGVLAAPPGYVGEVTLLTAGTVRTNPGRWIVPGSQAGTQGDYLIVNDAPADRAIGAQDATLTRLDRLVVQVRDTAYTPNEGVDDADVRVLPGTPALTGATVPALPPNSINLGTITVPPTPGVVTFTPAVLPMQVALGGILPMFAADPGGNGAYVGQYREHPTLGLQRWNGTTWSSVPMDRLRLLSAADLSLTSTTHPLQVGATAGPNIVADANQVQARNNGDVAPLYLNTETNQAGVRGSTFLSWAEFRGSLAGDDSSAQALIVPRLRVTAENDANAKAADGTGTASLMHGLQVGPDSGPNVIMDSGGEIIARDGNGRVAPLSTGGSTLEVAPATADTHAVTRGQLNYGFPNTGWTDITLASGWTTVGGGPGAKYRVHGGMVLLTFYITRNTAWALGQGIASWPVGLRPNLDWRLLATLNGTPWAEIFVNATTGAMSVQLAGAANAAIACSGSWPIGGLTI